MRKRQELYKCYETILSNQKPDFDNVINSAYQLIGTHFIPPTVPHTKVSYHFQSHQGFAM